MINDRIVNETQEKVRNDLNSARVIYNNQQNRISDVVRLTANRSLLTDAILKHDLQSIASELSNVRQRERLDILTITDSSGKVILRSRNNTEIGDDQSTDRLILNVLVSHEAASSTENVSAYELAKESPYLIERAYLQIIDTPLSKPSLIKENTSGMMQKTAAPIFDYAGNLIGVIYGGVLINQNYEIVDEIKQTVYQGLKYKGEDIGTATIFQNDVRISTNVFNTDGSRAIGTRVSGEVYDQVILAGKQYIGRAYVVNNWYISAYEPIRNMNDEIIGILYVGILEQRYADSRREIIIAYLTITFISTLIAMLLSIRISRTISQPLSKLVLASRELAKGNFEVKVDIKSNDEMGELASTFNYVTQSLKERDDKLKEYTKSKIMESERLALIGQLAANVAHELNNPLVGIVTYSHLLLEKLAPDDPSRDGLIKIVTQANRTRDIIKGLLDFSRQQKPDKILCNLNDVITGCISLLEDQAIFHNIHIVKSFAPDLPLVVIDPSQMERVFINLMLNAAEAMDGNGKLSITSIYDRGNDAIELRFSDTGPGISEENIGKIFDPFFTTKDTGHGVGLGLAISYGIIKEHKGTISVESKHKKGTTFIIRLPISTADTGEKGIVKE